MLSTATQLEISPSYISRVPFDEERVGAAAVYCSDGRFGDQMDEFLHEYLGLPRYDRVAVPGGAACLAGGISSFWQRTALERQLSFLIQEHALKKVILIAHHNCAFYKRLAARGENIEPHQAADLKQAATAIHAWGLDVEIHRYFARRVDGRVVFEQWDGAHFPKI